MDSKFGALQFLVLPYGATSGKRIILNGVDGLIQVYDAADQLVGQIDANGVFSTFDVASSSDAILAAAPAPPSLKFLPKAFGGHVLTRGAISSDTQTVPDRVRTVIDSPTMDGLDLAQLTLEGESAVSSPAVFVSAQAPSRARFQVFGTIDAADDYLFGTTQSMPRGKMGTPFDSTANDAARNAGVNTDMAVTFTADDTRLYEVTLKVQFNVGTTGVVYALDLVEGGTVGGADGTVIDRFDRWSAAEVAAGSGTAHANSSVQYRPTAGAKTVRVGNDGGSGGTVTLVGTATIRRQLSVKDIGAR